MTRPSMSYIINVLFSFYFVTTPIVDAFTANNPLIGTFCRSKEVENSNNNNPMMITPHSDSSSITSMYLAKKKRRRRKNEQKIVESSTSEQETEEYTPSSTDDDLPDFELESTDSAKATSSSPARKTIDTSSEITAAMMSSNKNKGEKSIKELIADRSMEKMLAFDKLEFDEPVEKVNEELPDLIELAKNERRGQKTATLDDAYDESSSISGGVGKKRALQEERRRQATARMEELEKEGKNPLSDIPFLTNEAGEVSGIKILESGAWLGIFLLVGWEIYLNSPLFERAAPMVPVVYELLM